MVYSFPYKLEKNIKTEVKNAEEITLSVYFMHTFLKIIVDIQILVDYRVVPDSKGVAGGGGHEGRPPDLKWTLKEAPIAMCPEGHVCAGLCLLRKSSFLYKSAIKGGGIKALPL